MQPTFRSLGARDRLLFILKYVFMALCVTVALFPIIWVILSSFKTNAEILSNGISLPTSFSFDGYAAALEMAPIFKFFGNSVFITCAATFCNVLIFAMAGYVFARCRFRGDKLVYLILSLSLVIPMTALLQPVYSVINNLGLYDTKAGLILVNTALNMPMSLLILRGSFQSIPNAIE
ncbi:MAG: carbohydrate ABC transporter permease, partial [Butyricicoccus sp.]|nr:carbohydrate ABC transporter permease [Butyricicoccus sp.]